MDPALTQFWSLRIDSFLWPPKGHCLPHIWTLDFPPRAQFNLVKCWPTSISCATTASLLIYLPLAPLTTMWCWAWCMCLNLPHAPQICTCYPGSCREISICKPQEPFRNQNKGLQKCLNLWLCCKITACLFYWLESETAIHIRNAQDIAWPAKYVFSDQQTCSRDDHTAG